METVISARSPLFEYSPCRDCGGGITGWRGTNGTDGALVGSTGRLAIAFNFTGTGVSFDFAQRIPEDWLHKLTVNSSAPPTSADITSTSLTNLVPGAHRFTLELFPPAPDPFSPAPPSNASVTFTGATGYLGAILNAATKNVTIDDTAWRTGEVVLSPAWNMMEGGQGGSSNWINTTQIDAERGTAGENWNSSLSWTEERGANTTIAFAGEAVWVYGVAGGEAGRYEVLVDGTEMGRYNASGGAKAYGQVLYHTSSLAKGNHTLTLRNLQDGGRLSFDRLVAMSGLAATPRPSTSAPIPSATSTPVSSTKKLSDGALAGIGIGAVLSAILLIGAIVFFLMLRERRRRQGPSNDEYSSSKYDEKNKTFLNFPRSTTPPFSRMDGSEPAAAGFLARAWPFHRNGPPSSKESFIPGMPSTPRAGDTSNLLQPPSGDRYTSFLKFSKSPKRGRESPRPNISSPTPFERPGFADAEYRNTMQTRATAEDTEGISPALLAAISGRVVSPLAQLRDGALPPTTAESESYFPKMTALGSVFAGPPKAPALKAEENTWKRPSVDTIGRIFGQYASPRDTVVPDRGGLAAMDTIEGREKWDERVRKVGQPHAF